ncbi:D-alanyl-lipoteichoic acid biosynthesis protein DltD [Streptococcus iniae]|uniref:D-alanyl-lipoteichoic acid biosynthesis protein DltD n=1 Tax=Streptococcus iniae TaxID=1346 RepID=UPI002B319B49|nr:D-alanyl-lipoteichoic acid biosynthesis protein DltD [Streptococcus iniae]WNZ90488.1 D-alanyl-lipoteichoic acid biosynthesis protein DltD [Streptococcus iniae]WNZ94755.1 D-alanyl-lipoteichoic acid biosynthesis protein DltD [Streptococcus iniae]WNZ96517.1 D-alanyl-lipoteichoic acid biosynthesis protein DltD [Streptococcus iniae]WNZ97734.1 D-alanyl-lipoteichoic acid biosynthesis protein DltD [Streptococcus iniae]
MRKRLWVILGPVVIAICLVSLTVFSFPLELKHSLKEEKANAVAISDTSFKNGLIKRQALSDPKHRFVPFFGSSEWNRMDSMHPSVLAEKYNRSYRPYLIGKRGSASLSQYYGMRQISKQLHQKKAVFVISPQWFTPEGTNPGAVQSYLSNSQVIAFLLQSKNNEESKIAAKRMLAINPGVAKANLLKKISNGIALSKLDRGLLKLEENISLREESLFSFLGKSDNFENRIMPRVLGLPKQFSYDRLHELATKRGEIATSNNKFRIKNSFYSARIAPQFHLYKNFQSNNTYIESPEYNDFQLVLSEFAKQKTEVLFVITPVNKAWAQYTGLNQKKYQEAVDKMKYQLELQGFNNIADFSKNGGDPYFMEDTIHIGWNGWLAFDKAVYPFLTEDYKAPHYEISDYFLSDEWATTSFHLKKK